MTLDKKVETTAVGIFQKFKCQAVIGRPRFSLKISSWYNCAVPTRFRCFEVKLRVPSTVSVGSPNNYFKNLRNPEHVTRGPL